jgi:hypothetical protein
MKISGEGEEVAMALQAIPQKKLQKCFQQGSIIGLNARLLERSNLKVTPLIKL